MTCGRLSPQPWRKVSLTAIKYSTQSAEQMVSKTKVIRPSSDPVAPVTDVGGLFNREGTKYLHSALQTGSRQSFKFLFVHQSLSQKTCPCRMVGASALSIGCSRVIFLSV